MVLLILSARILIHAVVFGSLQLIRDESREKPLELEMGWISAATNFKHVLVPKELVLEADTAALAAVAGQTIPTEGRLTFALSRP